MSTRLKSTDLQSVEVQYQNLGINLKPSSKGLWRAHCPFPNHKDNDPSFTVYPDGGYHCFGCSAHGELKDIYEFFGKPFDYHISRIDLTLIPDSDMRFVENLFKKLEKQLQALTRNRAADLRYAAFDMLDRLWIDIGFEPFVDKLRTAIFIKAAFQKIIKRVEGVHEKSIFA